VASVRERAARAPRLSPEDRQQIARWAASAHEGTASYGRWVLGEATLPLLLTLAARYEHRAPLTRTVRCGLAGLDAATRTFDHTKGFRFSTFATWWIRRAITEDLRR
jgi:RNA polymerase primary sigma factor